MGPLGEWLPETIWPKLKSLERIKRFQNIGDAMQSDSDDWQVRLFNTVSGAREAFSESEGTLTLPELETRLQNDFTPSRAR